MISGSLAHVLELGPINKVAEGQRVNIHVPWYLKQGVNKKYALAPI